MADKKRVTPRPFRRVTGAGSDGRLHTFVVTIYFYIGKAG